MAIPKKGMRSLAHKGANYGWRIRKKPTYEQAVFSGPMTISIQSRETDSPQVLYVELSITRPDNRTYPHQTQIRPGTVREIIDAAIHDGWNPTAGGKAFRFKYGVIMDS